MEQQSQIELFGASVHPLAYRSRGYPLEASDGDDSPALLRMWQVVKKHCWLVGGLFLACFLLIAVDALRQRPVYRAQSLIEIQREHTELVSVQDLFTLDPVSDSYLQSQQKILRSYSLAGRVQERLELKGREEFQRGNGWLRRPRSFQDRLGVNLVRGTRLMEIRFESEDPALAAEVVNAVVAAYMEQNLQSRWDAARSASSWLSQQLIEVQGNLERASANLQRFVEESKVTFLDTPQGGSESILNERLRQLQRELTQAQADRQARETVYRLAEEGRLVSDAGDASSLLRDLEKRRTELEREHAELRQKFGPQYPLVIRNQRQIEEVDKLLARERQNELQRAGNQYEAALRREQLLAQAFDEQLALVNRGTEQSVRFNILKREVETNKQLYDGLLQRLQEAGVSAGLRASNIRVVDPATPPAGPVRPNLPLAIILAALTGLGIGLGAALLSEHLDNTIKEPEEVERYLHAPALAIIPRVELPHPRLKRLARNGQRKLRNGNRGAAICRFPEWHRLDADSGLPVSMLEAFRNLRTSVMLATASGPPRSLLVTSTQPGEGKTTIAANLALSLAQLGWRVLLVDADMRRPSVRKVFDLEESPGLASYLACQYDWRDLVICSDQTGLHILPSGPAPPNPAELLSSQRMRHLLWEAMQEYRMVIVDSPVLLNLADSRILSALVEAVVLVARSGHTQRDLVRLACAHVKEAGASLIGVVLNDGKLRANGEYLAYYQMAPQPSARSTR